MVHDGTQKLTSSLGVCPDASSGSVEKNEPALLAAASNRQMSVSAEGIPSNVRERRTRHRRRTGG